MISRPVRIRKTIRCFTRYSLLKQRPVIRGIHGSFSQAGYWILRAIACFSAVFILLFCSAEAASGKGFTQARVDTRSLLSAQYDEWEQPIEVSILPEILKGLSADGINVLKENDTPDPGSPGQGFLIAPPAVEASEVDPGEIPDPGGEDQPGVLPGSVILPPEEDHDTSILPSERDDEGLFDRTAFSGLDEEIPIAEIRESIEEVQESIRSGRAGGTNTMDSELIEQVRELQEIRDRLDLPDVYRFP